MRLFLVQDSDNTCYVIANDWHDAVNRWREWYRDEYDDDPEDMEPDGIQLLGAERGDVVSSNWPLVMPTPTTPKDSEGRE